jgi:hypothetical protein
MKKSGIVVTILQMLAVLFMCCPGAFAATDGYYQLSEVSNGWEVTDASRLKATSADYDYTYGDEASLIYRLPWTAFSFYGQAYNGINVDTNGNIWFVQLDASGNVTSGPTGSAHSFDLPSVKVNPTALSRGPVIAAWNNDLSSYYYGGVFVQHKTSPERVVIEWQTETYTDEGYNRINDFEVVLFSNGIIRMNYQTFNPTTQVDYGSGISKGDGTHYLNPSTTAKACALAVRSFVYLPVQASPVPQLSIVPSSDSFGSVAVNVPTAPHTFTVSNTGFNNLVISPITLTGTNAAEFSLVTNTCTPGATSKILLPTEQCQVSVNLTALSFGAKSANFTVPSNDPTTPVYTVSLNGIAQPSLSITKTGTGSGTVTSTPGGIACGGGCTNTFSTGAQVTLSAVPGAGALFTGWSGGCSGTGATCTLTLNVDTLVNANFSTGNVAKILSTLTLFNTLQVAFTAAVTGDTILTPDGALTESINFNAGKQVSLKGGYDSSFSSVTGTTTLRGPLTINSGSTLTVNKLTIQLP